MKHSRRNILVVRLSALGDVAMTIPAIYSVATVYPQHTFHVVTTSPCDQLFVASPANIILHPFEHSKICGVAGTLRLLSHIRALRIDSVADLHNVLRSWMIDAYCLVCRKSVRMLNKQRHKRRSILQRQASADTPYTMRYFDVFAHLGLPCKPQFSSLYAHALPALPEGFLKRPQTAWIGVAPFARYANKTYPIEKMHKAVLQLIASGGKEIFLFGSKGKEALLLNEWCRDSSQVHCVAGLLPLNKELALMSHLDVMVTMDSANMHLASLVGVRVISIWGGTIPACGFLGWGQNEADTLIANSPCQPCTIAGKNDCRYGNFHCLMSITPEDIFNKVDNIIHKKQRCEKRH